MPNVTGLLGNQTIGKAAGAYLYLDTLGKSWGGSAITVIEGMANDITSAHLPDLNSLMTELTQGTASAQIKQYIKLWLVGYGLKSVGIAAKYGNVAQRFSEAAAKGVVMAAIAGYSTSWNSPPGPSKSTASNFLAAKPTGAYKYSY